jgi:hypothetical protein
MYSPSMIASGKPVCGSFKIITAIIEGKPVEAFLQKPPAHFIPAIS